MCVIIAKPFGVKIPDYRNVISRAIDKNKDGWGFMTTTGEKKVQINRHFDDRNLNMEAAIKFYEENQDEELVFHARVGTQGTKGLENTHPYPIIENEIYLVHNGWINIDRSKDYTKSDSFHFAQWLSEQFTTVVKPKNPDATLGEWLRWPKNKETLSKICKDEFTNSKVVILDKEGFTIFNEDATTASWKDGVWYSNDSPFQGKVFQQPIVAVAPIGKSDLQTGTIEDEINEQFGHLDGSVVTQVPADTKSEEVVAEVVFSPDPKENQQIKDIIEKVWPDVAAPVEGATPIDYNDADAAVAELGNLDKEFDWIAKAYDLEIDELKDKIKMSDPMMVARVLFYILHVELSKANDEEEKDVPPNLEATKSPVTDLAYEEDPTYQPTWACLYHRARPGTVKIRWDAQGNIVSMDCHSCDENRIEMEDAFLANSLNKLELPANIMAKKVA